MPELDVFGAPLEDNPADEQQTQEIGAEDAGQEAPAEGQAEQQPAEQPQQPILGKFKSVDDLATSYREAESALTRQAQENALLRQQLAALLLAAQQAQAAQQPTQTQVQQPVPQMPTQGPAPAENPEEWLEKFYSKGPEAVQELVQRVLAQREAQYQQQLAALAAQQQQIALMMQAQQLEGTFKDQVRQVSQRYEDFKELVPEIQTLVQENPRLAEMPNAVETLYLLAKARRQTADGSSAAKAAARVPGSGGGGGARTQRAQTPEDIIRQQVFGPESEGGGVFG